MNVHIYNLPQDVNQYDVIRSIATIVHSSSFTPRREEHAGQRDINFKVRLNPCKAGGVGNDGSGTLTLPTQEIGNKFRKWVQDTQEDALKIKGKKVKFEFRRGWVPPEYEAFTLEKTPFTDPDIEEEFNDKLSSLSRERFRIDAVQFGILYQREYPSNEKELPRSREFSIEWEGKDTTYGEAWLFIEYDHKLFRIMLGSEMTDSDGSSIAIEFSNIERIAVGHDLVPYICFNLLTPPILERIDFHPTERSHREQGLKWKSRHRITSIHDGHEVVAPYAHQLRLLIHDDASKGDVLVKLKNLCKVADPGLASRIVTFNWPHKLEASGEKFFKPTRLHRLREQFKDLPWPIAFQLEALLYNGLLHTKDMDVLTEEVQKLKRSPGHDDQFMGSLLRHYRERLEVRPAWQSPLKCFEKVASTFTTIDSKLTGGNLLCYHATFTPTRMLLEGPYVTESNRVIRAYGDYLDHFIRVGFCDENRLRCRSEDGLAYLEERIGTILQHGFKLAGRDFEFLAYSSSSLREHTVWFMNPFHHPEKGWLDSKLIRQSLGDFKSDKALLRQPSKYAARLALAFTATNPSVKVLSSEWEEVGDLGSEPYLFSDGNGTISKSLGDEIWFVLCAQRGDHVVNSVQPTTYQIRFLGYKGVVSVDEELDKHPHGIRMRLRKSMKKFSVSFVEWAEIEIAQSFDHPIPCFLNQPLITVLEGLNVSTEAFTELQERAVADARTLHDSSPQFRTVLDAHGLGRPYRLSHLLRKIEDLQLELRPRNQISSFDNPFFYQLRMASIISVLRDIKNNARIPIPNSYLLVGVADEGPSYKDAGFDNVYVLPEGHIFACIQHSQNDEPRWLEGACSISRSPVAHPGDVQRVRAIGRPPNGMLCLFAHLKNTVVLPSVGKRSLASQPGGGDLDGDQFAIIFYDQLLPPEIINAAEYKPQKPKEIEDNVQIKDICNFIVEYINSDILGLLSIRLLVIADQSKFKIRDKDCIKVAELCSQAVDYAKHGNPVNKANLPGTLIRRNPDWRAAEVDSPRSNDYYKSTRTLGVLYRSLSLDKEERGLSNSPPTSDSDQQPPIDPISLRLKDELEPYLTSTLHWNDLPAMFQRYKNELNYICAIHVPSNKPNHRLNEVEVVLGTILGKCTEKRYRKDQMYQMRLHTSNLVRTIRQQIVEDLKKASQKQVLDGLAKAWAAWEYSQFQNNDFGAHSFGLIALGMIFDCMDVLIGGLSGMSESDSEVQGGNRFGL